MQLTLLRVALTRNFPFLALFGVIKLGLLNTTACGAYKKITLRHTACGVPKKKSLRDTARMLKIIIRV